MQMNKQPKNHFIDMSVCYLYKIEGCHERASLCMHAHSNRPFKGRADSATEGCDLIKGWDHPLNYLQHSSLIESIFDQWTCIIPQKLCRKKEEYFLLMITPLTQQLQ